MACQYDNRGQFTLTLSFMFPVIDVDNLMPYQLLNLRNVPEDEAEEVRALLDAQAIPYYETPPGPWGVSMGAIWIKEATHAQRAQQLLDEYSHERQQRMRAAWITARKQGQADTWAQQLRRYPLRTVALTLLAGLLIYATIKPFLTWAF